MLKAAIYDPYLDTLGGGERYVLTVAEILLKNNYSVDLFWSGNPKLIEAAQQRFSLDLSDIKLVPDIFGLKPEQIDLIEEKQNLSKLINRCLGSEKINNHFKSLFEKYQVTRKYDLIFFLSDGSTPILFSKKNILHVQVPFVQKNNPQKKVFDILKSKIIYKIVCNSKFTAKFQNQAFKNKIKVLYPPVDIDKFENNPNKENIILSVGRFDNVLNAKKQDVLIDAFRELYKFDQSKNWKLVLAGGSLTDPSQNAYLRYLKEKAIDLPIEFVVNPNFTDLKNVYSVSSIYWHAAGFDVDEDVNPQNTEHFGITIVEAMMSGLVPIVVKKGGIPEIIENGINGYLWESTEDLVQLTHNLIKDFKLMKTISEESQKTCQRFSKENFEKQFLSIIKN